MMCVPNSLYIIIWFVAYLNSLINLSLLIIDQLFYRLEYFGFYLFYHFLNRDCFVVSFRFYIFIIYYSNTISIIIIIGL